MADVTIRVLEDGPYLIKGDVEIVDAKGEPIPQPERGWALCRCGGSTTKPFCDGTHSKIGFRGAREAVAEEEQGGSQ